MSGRIAPVDARAWFGAQVLQSGLGGLHAHRDGHAAAPALRQAWLGPIALLACAYALAALAGQLLAFESDFASPVWPAAGVALAGLLLGGLRLWPGILIGNLAFSLLQLAGASGPGNAGTGAQVLQAAVVAGAATLQAMLGARLVWPGFGQLALGRERVVLRCLLLGGPLACLVAPTIGVSSMVWSGRIGVDAAAANWLTWWVGDSIGVVLFTPLVLLASPRVRGLWRGRLRMVAAPLLGAAVVLVLAMNWFNNQQAATQRSQLSEHLALAQKLMQQRQDAAVQSAVATGSFITSSAYLAPQEFAAFAANMRQPGLLSLQWLPRVRPDNAPAAGDRLLGEFPVQFADPPQSQWKDARLDVGAHPAATDALVQARDSAQPVASAPMALPSSGTSAVLVFVPVYRYGVDAQALSLDERRAQFKGFVLAVLDPVALSANMREAVRPYAVTVSLSDIAPGAAPRPLFAASGAQAADAPAVWRYDVPFYGRTWCIKAYATQYFGQVGNSGGSRMFLLASLAAAVACAFFVLASAGRNRVVEREVALRTAQLEQGRDRLELAMDLSDMVEWDFDVASAVFTLNDRYYRFLHTTAEREGGYAMAAEHWARTFVHADDLPRVLQVFSDVGTPGFTLPDDVRDLRLVCRDGSVRHVHIYVEFEHDRQGRVNRVHGTTQDVTERKRIEEALRSSEQYNRSIVESSIDCVKVLSLDGAVLDMTPQGRALLCVRDFEQIRHRDWLDFWQRDGDRAHVRQALATARAGGTARFQGYTPTFDGTPKWWDVVVTPILDGNGRPVRLLGVSRDITAEREASDEIVRINEGLEREVRRRTAELTEREALLRATFDGAPVGISHVGADGRLLRVNPRMCEITGHSAAQLIGSHGPDLTHPDDRAQDQAFVDRLMAGVLPDYTLEKRYLRQDGTVVWVREHGSAVRDDQGRILYRVAISEDISEARLASQMRIASEQRYRDLFEFNPMPMWTYDSETLAFTDVNRAALHHYGYDREEFLAMTIADIRPEQDIAQLHENIASRGANNRNGGEFVHRRKNGDRITVEITSYGIETAGRAGRLVLANDITERKRADELLAAQKRVLEGIASDAPLGGTLEALTRIVENEFGGKCGSILLLDRATGRLRHGAASSLPAAYVQAVDGVAIGPAVGCCGAAAFSGTAVTASDIASDPSWADHRELALAHGLRACWSLPIRDARGQVIGTFAVYDRQPGVPSQAERQLVETLSHTAAIAITKEQEKRALRESEQRFRAIYEKSPIGIVLVSADGTIMAANPRQCELTGYSAAELTGARIQDLTHDDDRRRDMDQLDSVWGGDRDTYSIEKRAIRKDGSAYWVSISGAIVRDDAGTPQYGIRVIQDVTDRVHADRALRDSEQRFRSTFELAALGIAHVGPDGNYLRVNPSMARITGYDEAQLLVTGPLALTLADDQALDQEQHRRLLAGTCASYSVEKRYVHRNGSPVWTNATVSAVRDDAGELLYTFVMLEDISRRKLAEFELQQQQELNRLLLENLSEGVVACDGEGRLIHFNKAAREWHGTDLRESPPEQWASHYDLFEGDGRTPLALERIPLMRAFKGETVHNAEMSIARHGLPARLVLASGAPLFDTQGIKRGAVVVMHDVTDRQRHMRELKCINDLNEATRGLADPEAIVAVTTRRLGQYLDVAHCAYADVAPDGEQLDVVRDFACDGRSIVGSYRLSNIGPDTARALRAGSVVVLDDVQAQLPAGEGRILRAGGMRSAMIFPLHKGNTLRAIMAVGHTDVRHWTVHEKALVQSITERCWATVERERAQHALQVAATELQQANAAVEHERASLARRVAERTEELTAANASLSRARDAAEAASRAKTAFLATISHEIRTPMNGVLGAMELLERLGLDGERESLLATAQNSARSLLGLLNDLLDMAKIEAGRIEIVPAPMSVQAIVDQIVSTHLPNAINKNIGLRGDVDDNTAPAWVRADALRLRQILGNLVSNAVKFTSTGGVVLSVRARPAGPGRHAIRFAVRDTGVGIPAQALETLFQPFEQGTAELARQSGGTGLGLAISRGLAERMGGSVRLESRSGEGTTAILELTLEVAQPTAGPAPSDGEEDDDTVISRFHGAMDDSAIDAHVLVVDDHPVNRRLMMRQLEQLGLVADLACDGVEALERLQHGTYRMVITDCEMPRLDGYGLARAIRRSDDARVAGMPILACTAHALPDVERRCRDSGMNEVLTKPIALGDLARLLRGLWPVQPGLPQEPGRAPRVRADAVLDARQLATMTGGDKLLEQELLDDFLSDAHDNMAGLQAAVDAGAHERCKMLAHRGLGAARIVGAATMASALTELQRMAKEQAPMEDLQQALAPVRGALSALVRQRHQPADVAPPRPQGTSMEIDT